MDEQTAEQCEQLFAAVVTAKEGNKELSAPFKVLPQKSVSTKNIVFSSISLRYFSMFF